ncbi:MAG: hypothetical protein GC162_15360 [Planctomycetes bacterium]|nr:hypothetical protein [Planctomycetota bacterium]
MDRGMGPTRRITMLVALGLLVISTSGRAEVFVEQSLESRGALRQLRDLLADQQWDEAAWTAGDLLLHHREALVSDDDERFVRVQRVVLDEATKHPQLLAAIRAHDEHEATRALDHARGDVAAMRSVFDRFAWTVAGQRAALEAAGLLIERADFAQAAELMDALIDQPGLADRAADAHTLAVLAAAYRHDLPAIAEHGRQLQALNAGDRLDDLLPLVRRVKTFDVAAADDPRPGVRLRLDNWNGQPSQPLVLICESRGGADAGWTRRPVELNATWKDAAWAGRPLLAGDRVYASLALTGPANLRQYIVVSLRFADGSLFWSKRLLSRSSASNRPPKSELCELAIGDGGLYAAFGSVAVGRLGADSGAVTWMTLLRGANDEIDPNGASQAVSPWIRQRMALVPGGLVVIGDEPAAVRVFDPRSGEVTRTIEPDAWRGPLHLRRRGDNLTAFGERIVEIDGRTLDVSHVSTEPFDLRSFAAEKKVDVSEPMRYRPLPMQGPINSRVGSPPLDTRVPDRRVR